MSRVRASPCLRVLDKRGAAGTVLRGPRPSDHGDHGGAAETVHCGCGERGVWRLSGSFEGTSSVKVTLKQKDEKEKEKERQKEKEEAKKAKKTLRHFSDRVFMLPDVQGWRGFIESNEAKAALALVQDLPFFSAYHGSLGLYDHVTFTVRRGLSGLEAVDLVAERLGVPFA